MVVDSTVLIPIDLADPRNLALAWAVATGVVLLRYLLFAVPPYVIFWRKEQRQPAGSGREDAFKRLHNQQIPKGQIRDEVHWSLLSSIIFGLAAVVMGVLWQQGLTQIYSTIDGGVLSIAYLPLSFVIYAICHELYYYGTHRWMHQPGVYQRVHAVHHRSRKTSPFASFSFHPYEAVIQAAFIPLMVLVVPIHPIVLLAYLTFMTVTAVSNHLGVELIRSAWLRQYFISGSHHDLHHKAMNVHFGLFFTASDRWFGTEISRWDAKHTAHRRQGEHVA